MIRTCLNERLLKHRMKILLTNQVFIHINLFVLTVGFYNKYLYKLLYFSMGLFELISHVIFPNEYDFDGEYFCGRPIFNQPQLLGKFCSHHQNLNLFQPSKNSTQAGMKTFFAFSDVLDWNQS